MGNLLVVNDDNLASLQRWHKYAQISTRSSLACPTQSVNAVPRKGTPTLLTANQTAHRVGRASSSVPVAKPRFAFVNKVPPPCSLPWRKAGSPDDVGVSDFESAHADRIEARVHAENPMKKGERKRKKRKTGCQHMRSPVTGHRERALGRTKDEEKRN